MGKQTYISVSQAERLIRRAQQPAPTVTVPLADAVGAVLRVGKRRFGKIVIG